MKVKENNNNIKDRIAINIQIMLQIPMLQIATIKIMLLGLYRCLMSIQVLNRHLAPPQGPNHHLILLWGLILIHNHHLIPLWDHNHRHHNSKHLNSKTLPTDINILNNQRNKQISSLHMDFNLNRHQLQRQHLRHYQNHNLIRHRRVIYHRRVNMEAIFEIIFKNK